MRRLAQHPFVIAVAFTAIGFFVLFLAWNAAAELDHVSGQMPILISGGLSGLGLIAVGLTMVVTTQIRRSESAVRADLSALSELLSAVDASGARSVPGDARVIAGRDSFHDPACGLVAGRTDLSAVDLATALADNLAPCRICKPSAA